MHVRFSDFNFFAKTGTIFSICVDVIFLPKNIMPAISVQNGSATPPTLRHGPIVGVGEFLLSR